MGSDRATILVVDDKENMLLLVEKILASHHEVTGASTGEEALALLAARRFDLVVTDVRMPGVDGFEITRVVKQRYPSTEVIMMTGYASIEAAVQAIRLGAYDYIQKPFDPDDVLLVVARALENKRARDRAAPAAAPPGAAVAAPDQPLSQMSYKDAVNLAREKMSRDYLTALLQSFAGNITRAAERAGMERESLHRLLKRHGVRADAFRDVDEGRPTTGSGRDDDQE